MSEKTPMLATKRRPLGKPGGPGLFHDENLELPPYVQNIAHSLMAKRGLPKSRAIQLALGAVERWKNGGDDVSPEVRAAAAKAWAQWEAAKAKARATPNKGSQHANDAGAIELSWDAAAHPRAPAGAAAGGQFVAVGQARDQAAGEAQKDQGAQDLYRRMMEGKLKPKDLNDADLQKLSRILYSFKTADTQVVKARIVVANELSRRGMDVKKYGALGGGTGKMSGPAKPSGNVDDPKLLDSLLSGPDGGRELLLAADRAGVIDLAALQHWKHGWKPLTPYATAVKAKQLHGSTKGKGAELPKSVKSKSAAAKAQVAGKDASTPKSTKPRQSVKSQARTVAKQNAEYDALSVREKRAYGRAYQPGVQGNHAAGMKAVEHFRGTEEGRADQRSSLNMDEHRAYRQAAKDITDPAAAHRAGMAAVAPLKRKRDEERVAKEAQRKAAQERADVELRKRMADSKAKAAAMGLEIDPSRPQQQLVRQNGKTIGVLEARMKDSSRKEGSRPALVDEEPDMYVSRVAGSHTSKVGGGETSVVRKQHASIGDALAHVKQHHTTDSKRAQKDLQGGLFEVPKSSKAPRSSKAPSLGEGEVGGPIKFEGGRTGTVWADAPQGGKWVIPDDRRQGEAHAIYVDKNGRVREDMSSAVYQKDWLRGRARAASRRTSLSSRSSGVVELAQVINQIRKAKVRAA